MERKQKKNIRDLFNIESRGMADACEAKVDVRMTPPPRVWFYDARPFLELGEKVMPFWGCGGKSIASLRPVQFDMARSCLHGVVRKVFRHELG